MALIRISLSEMSVSLGLDQLMWVRAWRDCLLFSNLSCIFRAIFSPLWPIQLYNLDVVSADFCHQVFVL